MADKNPRSTAAQQNPRSTAAQQNPRSTAAQQNPRSTAAPIRRTTRWESICRRCGRCCYEKTGHGRAAVTNFRHPCIHLNVASRLCTIYETRFEHCSQCRKMTILHALFVHWLPPECGYVRRYRLWRNPARRRLA